MKFKYVVIHHPTDYAIHEAYTENDGIVIAVNGEPASLYGYSVGELTDITNAIVKDIKDCTPIEGDCEDLYEAFDNIWATGSDILEDNKVVPLRP